MCNLTWRRCISMKLYYYNDGRGNVGDDLNPWLWNKLIPTLFDEDERELFLGMGTLLNDKVPAEPRKLVFGSGIGYGFGPPEIDAKWKFYCVRGPLTARALGLPLEYGITDPAALVATLGIEKPAQDGGVAYMPHHISAWAADWRSISEKVGVRYIDPRWDVDRVLREIGRSSVLISEAMHGAILADTLRVPWVAVSCYGHILESKWLDWCSSLSVDYAPARLPGIWNADFNYSRADRLKIRVKRSLAKAGIRSETWTAPPRKSSSQETYRLLEEFSALTRSLSPKLSADAVFSSALDRLVSALERLKRDCLLTGARRD